MPKCEECGKRFANAHGVFVHKAKAHKAGKRVGRALRHRLRRLGRAARAVVKEAEAEAATKPTAHPVPVGEKNGHLVATLRAKAAWHRAQAQQIDAHCAEFIQKAEPYIKG